MNARRGQHNMGLEGRERRPRTRVSTDHVDPTGYTILCLRTALCAFRRGRHRACSDRRLPVRSGRPDGPVHAVSRHRPDERCQAALDPGRVKTQKRSREIVLWLENIAIKASRPVTAH